MASPFQVGLGAEFVSRGLFITPHETKTANLASVSTTVDRRSSLSLEFPCTVVTKRGVSKRIEREATRQWLTAIASDVISTHTAGRGGTTAAGSGLTDEAGERVDGTAAGDSLEPSWSAVVRHIARLPTPQREVLELRFRDALSYAEIASRLQLPLGTVHSRMARAKELIRTRVDDRSPAVDETRKSGDSVSPNPTPHGSRDQPPSKDLTAGGQTGC